MRQVYAETAEPLAAGLLSLAGSADLFVSGILTVDSMASIAEHDGVAHATALLGPFHPTKDGRAGLTAQNPRIQTANKSRTWVGRWLLSRSVTQAGRLVRQRFGMLETGPKGFVRTLDTVRTVLGASPLLVPTPGTGRARLRSRGPGGFRRRWSGSRRSSWPISCRPVRRRSTSVSEACPSFNRSGSASSRWLPRGRPGCG